MRIFPQPPSAPRADLFLEAHPDPALVARYRSLRPLMRRWRRPVKLGIYLLLTLSAWQLVHSFSWSLLLAQLTPLTRLLALWWPLALLSDVAAFLSWELVHRTAPRALAELVWRLAADKVEEIFGGPTPVHLLAER